MAKGAPPLLLPASTKPGKPEPSVAVLVATLARLCVAVLRMPIDIFPAINIPVVSVIGPLAISSITAAVVTESVFSLPGIGKLIVNGAANRDYTLVLGLVVLVTVVAVLLNLLVDLAYAWLDPKIRY